MPNYNTTGWKRFENDAKIIIGSTEIENIVPGSVRRRERQRERVGNRDRGQLTGMTVGDQRPQEIEFQIWRTKNTDALLAALLPAATQGMETFFTTIIKEPDYEGATTGSSYTYNKSMLPEGVESMAGGQGQDADKVTIRIQHYGDIVSPATY